MNSAAPYSPCLATTARGPQREHLARGLHEVGLAREHAQLGVVEQHAVDRLDHAQQRLAGGVDPQVHRVQRDEAGALALLAHAQLQIGLDVREEQHVALARGLGELGLELGEDPQLGVVGVGGVEVVVVVPAPEERLAAGDAARRRGCARRAGRERSSRRSPQSSPTGPTTCTSAKKEEASEKCTAVPPSMRSRSPNGVLTESNAMEPTTVMDMARPYPRRGTLDSLAAVAGDCTLPTDARDPDERVRRTRGAGARRAADPRARRRRGPDRGHARGR